jgi:uncharacterized protein YicC (UPF0701 family)
MTLQEVLQNEIEDSRRWIDRTEEGSTYKRDLYKRIELINWALENMKNSDINICEIIETGMNQIIDKINEMDDAIEADPLHSEVRILDWILYQVVTK